MTNYKLHNDCKVLSGYVYKNNKPNVMNGWEYHRSSQGEFAEKFTFFLQTPGNGFKGKYKSW